MIARREEPHPGAQLTFTDIDGHRYQVFITDHPEDDICFLEAPLPGPGPLRVRIRDAKDTGLANLPSAEFAINHAWLTVVLIAGDLLAWIKGLCLDGELARPNPNGCATRLLAHRRLSCAPARRTTLRIAEGWPWADDLVAAFGRLPNWSTA